MTRLGIIDLGSNSVRASIVDGISGKTIYNGKTAVKLSEGMNLDGMLKEEPMRRSAAALAGIYEIMKKFGVDEIFAVATAAVRKAKNGAEFVEFIKKETGIEINVISGEKEAEYDFYGVVGRTGIKNAVILDTGGGSTEIIGAKDGKMTHCESVQIGSRSIKELFFAQGETLDAVRLAEDKVRDIIGGMDWLEKFSGAPVIGIGGCNRTVARICIAESEDGLIEKYEVRCEKVFEIMEKVRKTAPSERLRIKGITPDRTDIIYGGLLPLKALMERLGSDRLIVTDAGLRDGIAMELMKGKI